ncbi:MAG: YchJ family metal-binding protein [Thiobacillaceae bacterium]
MKATARCPCGSNLDYAQCCGRFHDGSSMAPDAAALMRSRYSAYVKRLETYLRTSWHPDTCPDALGLDDVPRPQWIGLELKSHCPIDDNHATVEFVARYKLNGRAHRLHEVSRFERIDGQWLYVNGEIKA